jgi:exonuclease SbcC
MQDLQKMLAEVSEQLAVERLKQQINELQLQLQAARAAQGQYLTLDAKFDEEEKLMLEMDEVRSHLTQSQTQLAAEPDLQQQLAQLAEQLKMLDNPRGKSQILRRELKQHQNLEAEQTSFQASVEKLQTAIAQLNAQIQSFADLDDQMQVQQQLREQHREDYQIYLENQKLANSFKGRKQQLEELTNQLATLKQQMAASTEHQAQLAQTYDPAQVEAVQSAYREAQTQQITLSAMLPEKRSRLAEYEVQLTKLKGIQAKRLTAQASLKAKQKTERFIKFARKAYKEAGPRITERYAQSISREADKLFRELLNRPNVSLEWTRDYEIVVQEGAHSRRFLNLSGGEQMCAALAVRLALLKVLADINIAFFDEPTTNMDKPRRESLAEAIANIKSFRQLFVISHDDTFEKVTENVILVEREV